MTNTEEAQSNKQSFHSLFCSGESWEKLLIYNRLILTKSSSACDEET